MPYVSNRGVKIHYELEGQGIPIILVTGFAGTLNDWRLFGYSQVLNKKYQLVLVDPRGRGASDKPHDAAAYDARLMLEDVIAVLDDLKIAKAHYFGYSMGGRIGWLIPVYAPERFRSLIVGGSYYPNDGQWRMDNPILNAINDGLNMALKLSPERPMEFFVAAIEKKMGRPYPSERRAQMLTLDAQALVASFQGLIQTTLPKAEDILPKVALPCLIFAGEADSFYPGAKESASLIPGATFFSLPGLDHTEAGIRSDLVLPYVMKFLVEFSRKS